MLAVCQPAAPAFAATALMNADKNPLAAEDPDDDGRADRHPPGPDRGQHAGDRAPARLVPEQCHRDRADDLSRRRAEGLSGLPPARRLHDHEPRARTSSAIGRCSSISSKATRKAPTRPATSTTNIARCATWTRNSISRRSTSCSSATLLPKGELKHRGRRVDPAAIRDTALLAIEGERDDISGIGQTRAALDIATKLPASRKQYHLAKDVGHYGIFNGRKWREKIAPVLEKWIADND